jgi:hypothetical protein
MQCLPDKYYCKIVSNYLYSIKIRYKSVGPDILACTMLYNLLAKDGQDSSGFFAAMTNEIHQQGRYELPGKSV